MTDIRIRRLKKRYRLASRSQGTSRLDHVLREVIDSDILEAALERGGIRRTDEICIRRVSAKARLNEDESNNRLATAWSVSLADAIVDALNDASSNVVVYGSLHSGLCDMAVSALRGDFSRSWAWKQLGVWRGDDVVKPHAAATEVILALIQAPIAAPAVVREIARSGMLTRLLDVAPALWQRLVVQVLLARGIDRSPQHFQDDAAHLDEARGLAEYVVERSSIARELQGIVDDPATASAIAILAVLDADPGAVVRSRSAFSRAERTIAERLSRQSNARNAGARAGIEAGNRRTELADVQHRAENNSSSSIAARDGAPSDFGGLLFLLNLLRDFDFTSVMLELPGRSLQWMLYQIALLLLPQAAGDAALLAFAGLAPSQALLDELPASQDEAATLQQCCALIVVKLRSALNVDERDTDAEIVTRIASRRAEIIADPAWIEVHFKLSDVSTEVRRAGLDLDPGWLPWLGAVVRFIYG